MRKKVLFIVVFICLCSLMPAALWHVSLDKSSLPDVKEVDKLFNPFIYSQIKKQLDSDQVIVYEDQLYEKSGSSWVLNNLPNLTDQVFLYSRTVFTQVEVHDAAYMIATINNRKNLFKTAGLTVWLVILIILLNKAERKITKVFRATAAVLAIISFIFCLRLFRPIFRGTDLSNIQQMITNADYHGSDVVINNYYYLHNGKLYVFHEAYYYDDKTK